MRGLAALLFALVVVGGLAFVADQVVTGMAEERVAGEFEQSVGGDATAQLDGWPVSLGLLRGEVPEATINATAVPLRDVGAILPRLDVQLTDVTLPYARGGGGGALSATTGRFTATVDQAALTGIVAAAGVPDGAQVQIAGDALQVLVQGVTVDLDVSARDGALVVVPTNGLFSALSGGERVFPLAGLPPGTSLDSVQVSGGTVILTGPLDLATLVAAQAAQP